MSPIELVHGGYVHRRRISRLASAIGNLLPEGASLLDIGAGDGKLAAVLKATIPSLDVSGVDVLVRPETGIPVRQFDGKHVPLPAQSCDFVLLVDVLHHTEDPLILLREAARVSKRGIIIKDHLRKGYLADSTLRFMDRVGNCRHNVALPHNYWNLKEWQTAFDEIGLRVVRWTRKLRLYPFPADWIFGRSLHFLALLEGPATPAGIFPK